MPSKNVQALRPIYDHWGRGDWAYMPACYAGDFEWGYSDEFPGIAGVYRDTETPNPRMRTWLSGWEHWRCEAEEYVELADTVIVLTRYRGKGKGCGVTVDVPGALVWEMRDGLAVRLEIFADREAVLKRHEAPPQGGASRDTSLYEKTD
jgi:ketosteroid isomerase-like protein